MIAVLEDAIGCFQKCVLAPDKQHRRLWRETEAWIMIEEEYACPFSFDHVCDVVGLNAAYLRRRLREWRDQQLGAGALSGQSVDIHATAMPTGTGPSRDRRERRTFTAQFKAQTVRVVLERGRRIRAVARELDLYASLVSYWVRQAERAAQLSAAEPEELPLLSRENQSRVQPERTEDPWVRKIA